MSSFARRDLRTRWSTCCDYDSATSRHSWFEQSDQECFCAAGFIWSDEQNVKWGQDALVCLIRASGFLATAVRSNSKCPILCRSVRTHSSVRCGTFWHRSHVSAGLRWREFRRSASSSIVSTLSFARAVPIFPLSQFQLEPCGFHTIEPPVREQELNPGVETISTPGFFMRCWRDNGTPVAISSGMDWY